MRRPALRAKAALAAGTSGAAMAQYPCAPGYAVYHGVCQPTRPLGNSNPVSGEAAGAASGHRAAGPVGAVVGGAIGTATGTVTGTANMLSGSSPPPACARGYHWYNGYCYPNR
jgi:hypothetical protein